VPARVLRRSLQHTFRQRIRGASDLGHDGNYRLANEQAADPYRHVQRRLRTERAPNFGAAADKYSVSSVRSRFVSSNSRSKFLRLRIRARLVA
jgi:hypothetical protein